MNTFPDVKRESKNIDRLAALILAHKNISQLKRLIRALKHKNIDVFVHVDKKWKISDKEISSLLSENDGRVFICDNRISANLDSWSLVEATIELINKSKQYEKESGIKYRYMYLLSGQDYPIKSMDFIFNTLIESYPKPIIDCTPYDKSNWIYHKFNNLPSELMINSLINKYMKRGFFRKIIKLPFFIFYKIAKSFHTTFDDLQKNGCKLYGGSAWWILPDIIIDDLLEKYNNPNNKCISLLKNTNTPEETFFQIMVMNSHFSNMVNVNSKDMVAQNCMTYAYFSDEGKPFKGHPYIFTATDYKKIIKLPHLFARKFDDQIDSEILDLIDEKVLNVSVSEEV